MLSHNFPRCAFTWGNILWLFVGCLPLTSSRQLPLGDPSPLSIHWSINSIHHGSRLLVHQSSSSLWSRVWPALPALAHWASVAQARPCPVEQAHTSTPSQLWHSRSSFVVPWALGRARYYLWPDQLQQRQEGCLLDSRVLPLVYSIDSWAPKQGGFVDSLVLAAEASAARGAHEVSLHISLIVVLHLRHLWIA